MSRRHRVGALPSGLSGDELHDAVREGLAAVPEAVRVVLAVSGGPDSTGLAALTMAARTDLKAVVAHVRHGLRDDSADADAAAQTASRLACEFAEVGVTVATGREGPEAAARTARYAVLHGLAAGHGAGFLLLGHTADDQAETVLLNLGRGAGTAGLAGMRQLRVPDAPGCAALVRPLLRVRRGDVRAFVTSEGLPTVADPTNADPDQRRARVRAGLLPALGELSGGPGDPVGLLTRTADLARADADALDELAAGEAARLVTRWDSSAGVRVGKLAALPVAIATRVVRLLLSEVRGSLAGLDAEAVHAALALRDRESFQAPGGVTVVCRDGWLTVSPLGVPPGVCTLDHGDGG